VLPALLAVGGKPLWMGKLASPIEGEMQAEKLLIVRYPSHRRFLAMTLNPYYLAINRLREAGVDRFEASFTHASVAEPELIRRRSLVGLHFDAQGDSDALAEVIALFSEHGYELAYATRMQATIGFLEPPQPTDPNPLSFRELAMFAPPDGADPGAPASLTPQLRLLTKDFAMHLYEREPRSAYRPALPLVARAAA
jgi:hypothetical protein